MNFTDLDLRSKFKDPRYLFNRLPEPNSDPEHKDQFPHECECECDASEHIFRCNNPIPKDK